MMLLCSSLLCLLSPAEQSGLDNRTFDAHKMRLLGSIAALVKSKPAGKAGSGGFLLKGNIRVLRCQWGDYLFHDFIGAL